MNIINIYENFNSYFNADLKAIFEQCSKIASKKGYRLYLIGGIVRDLLISTHVIANEVKQSKKIFEADKIASSLTKFAPRKDVFF